MNMNTQDSGTIQRFIIPGRLIRLNEYTERNRTNRFAGNKAKQLDQKPIVIAISEAKLKPVQHPVILRYLWVEPNKRRKELGQVKRSKYTALLQTGG